MYQDGPAERVASPSFCGGPSLAEEKGSNPSRNGTAARAWCFALSFQNDFILTPLFGPTNPNPNSSLTTEISYLAQVIKAAALKELKDAYSGVPVRVVEGTRGDVQAAVVDYQNLTSDGICGGSVRAQHQASYVNNMLNAQQAYNIYLTSTQMEQIFLNSALGSVVVTAIGRGLGVSAAHEIGHQFVSDVGPLGGGLMDANPANDPAAFGTFNATGCSGAQPPIGDPSPWLGYYPSNPPILLHWEAPSLAELGQSLAGGWRIPR
jgi:hypothetical protein